MTYDERYMRTALAMARRGIGLTAPNPSVGCVIVKDGLIAGRGWTAAGGRPHAETIALERAGDKARGATAYVTLEPCCHHGKTPPCADALTAAGVVRVVIAVEDPHPDVSGGGIARLKAAGIEVVLGICEAEARETLTGFFSVQERKRPYITLKLATSRDRKIAGPGGERVQISGEEARDYAHLLRLRNDAIMVGSQTVLNDEPKLTCRLPGLISHSPVRIVVDRRLRTIDTGTMKETTGEAPLWVFSELPKVANKQQNGVEFITIGASGGLEEDDISDKNPLKSICYSLSQRGITTLLVEGGAALATSFLQENIVDKLVWIASEEVTIEGGLDALQGGMDIAQLPGFSLSDQFRRGRDTVRIFVWNNGKL